MYYAIENGLNIVTLNCISKQDTSKIEYFGSCAQSQPWSTSEQPENLGKIKLQENPVNKELMLLGNCGSSYKSTIFSIGGKTILESQQSNNIINVSHLPPGLYFLKLEFNGTIQVLKFNKTH